MKNLSQILLIALFAITSSFTAEAQAILKIPGFDGKGNDQIIDLIAVNTDPELKPKFNHPAKIDSEPILVIKHPAYIDSEPILIPKGPGYIGLGISKKNISPMLKELLMSGDLPDMTLKIADKSGKTYLIKLRGVVFKGTESSKLSEEITLGYTEVEWTY